MDEKRKPFENEIPKYKKKSKKKGQPRADHKHEYKEVVVHSWFDNPFKQSERKESAEICKVCTACGRIGEYVTGMFLAIDPDKYDVNSMEHWMVDDYFDKFAKKMEVNK
jgi:hypothetical protein